MLLIKLLNNSPTSISTNLGRYLFPKPLIRPSTSLAPSALSLDAITIAVIGLLANCEDAFIFEIVLGTFITMSCSLLLAGDTLILPKLINVSVIRCIQWRASRTLINSSTMHFNFWQRTGDYLGRWLLLLA